MENLNRIIGKFLEFLNLKVFMIINKKLFFLLISLIANNSFIIGFDHRLSHTKRMSVMHTYIKSLADNETKKIEEIKVEAEKLDLGISSLIREIDNLSSRRHQLRSALMQSHDISIAQQISDIDRSLHKLYNQLLSMQRVLAGHIIKIKEADNIETQARAIQRDSGIDILGAIDEVSKKKF